MPNHVTNVLRVTGYEHLNAPDGLADEVLAALRGEQGPVDFDRIIPMPKEQEENWYDWSIQNWGTKWNAYSAIAGKPYDERNEALFHFETAWAPPLPVIDALAAKFPQAHIRLIWADEGDDYQHRVWWSDGKRETDDA